MNSKILVHLGKLFLTIEKFKTVFWFLKLKLFNDSNINTHRMVLTLYVF